MCNDLNDLEILPIKLNDGSIIYFESSITGEEDVSFDVFEFEDIAKKIEAISKSLTKVLNKIKPDKATVEFGIELTVKDGILTAIILKGSGKANFKLSLEWSNKKE